MRRPGLTVANHTDHLPYVNERTRYTEIRRRDTGGEGIMEGESTRYLVRDQEESWGRPLDLLQGWGPPTHPPVRIRLGRWLVRVGEWLQGTAATCRGQRHAASQCGL